MTIWTRWGAEITIVTNCGEHQPKGFKAPSTLVRVRFPGDGDIGPTDGYKFFHTLRATEGWEEIQTAIDNAPTEELDPTTLKLAIKDAL
jgi:hypothetical protein